MKLKFKDQYVSFTHTLAVGVNIAQVTAFPDLSGSDAIVMTRLRVSLDAGSAAPSCTGAGLTIFGFAFVGKLQAAPADLLSAISFIDGSYSSTGQLGAAAQGVSSFVEGFRVLPAFPSREICVIGHTVNITNAATTILRFGCYYDIYTLTNSEYIQYLG